MKKFGVKRLVIVSALSLLLCVGVMQIASPAVYAAPSNSCGSNTDSVSCLFTKYLNPLIAVLGVTAGVAVVVGIIMGGIQYSMSAGDPQKVTKAKSTITKSLVGLVAFLLLGSFLQFLSPVNLTDMTTTSDVGVSVGNEKTAVCAGRATFLGMKPWFAYLPDGSFYSDCTLKSEVSFLGGDSVLPLVFLAIADDLLRVAALVAVAFVIVGGVKYMTSQGEPQQTKMALSSIINALIGLAVAVFAAAIISFIGGNLIK